MAAVGSARTGITGIRTPVFLVGVALALIAFIAMFTIGIIFARTAQGAGQVRVVVASQDILPRESILPGMVSVASVPSSSESSFAFSRVNDLVGYAALVTIYKGEVVTRNVVSSNPDQITAGQAQSYLPIPTGYIAISIPTSEQQGVAGYIAAGDYINIIAEVNIDLILVYPNGSTQQFPHRAVSRPVFSNIHVIRVGPPSTAPKQGQPQGIAASLTVVMSQCDADYLNWLLLNATLKYTLASYLDYNTVPQPPNTDCPLQIGPKAVDQKWHFTDG